MEPLQALAELDAAVQTISTNRATHGHLIKCVTAIRVALTAKDSQADGSKE